MIPSQRHKDEVLNRLDQIRTMGTCQMRRQELLIWWDQKRVSKGIWRDIRDWWYKELEVYDAIFVGLADDTYVFIWAEGLTAGDGSWFKPLVELADGSVELASEAK
jgi:hypothetical protein